MLVYRVENADGDGPYIAYNNMLREMYDEHNHHHENPADDLQPAPDTDGLYALEFHEYSGFASPEAAQAWFRGYGEVLHEADYHMTTWEAPDVRHGGRQVAFRKDTARVVASYPIMEYIR